MPSPSALTETNEVSELDLTNIINNINLATIENQSAEDDNEEEEEEESTDEGEEANDIAVQEELEKLMSMFCNPQVSGGTDGNGSSEVFQNIFQNLFSGSGVGSQDPCNGFEFLFDTSEIATLYEGSTLSENAGIDLFMPENVEIPARSFGNIVDLKVVAVLREDCNKTGSPSRAFWLLPRSSTGLKTPLRLSNNMGLIDAGYRNTLKAIVDNLSDFPFLIEKGSRLFQVCTGDLQSVSWKKVEQIEDTQSYERGQNGLGDSGK
jgi:dUTP pyrophosphatase